MRDFLLLQHPGLMLLYGAGLLLALLDARIKASRGWITWLSGALALAAAGFLIVAGGTLWEAAALLCGYLLLVLEVKL